MATKEKARGEAGRKNTSKIEDNKAPPESQDIYTPEEALIGAALTSWEDVAPLAIPNDLFCDPTLLKTWKALVANPAAGIPGLPKDLKPRALRCFELYAGEDPGVMIALLTEAHHKRTLKAAGEILLHQRPEDSAASILANAKAVIDTAAIAPVIDTVRWTPETLAAAEFPEVKWLIPNLLPTGITMLAGRPKTGKSWLALLWGGQIEGGAIYATYEDTARRLKYRTEKLGITGKDLTIIPHPPWQMPQALEELTPDINGNDPSTVIIDPWALFKPPRRDNSRIYEVDYEAFNQLRTWANEMNVSVLVIHHSRKPTKGGGGDFLDEPLGSTALMGAVDTGIVLERKNNAEAILHIRGRDVEAQELALAFDNGYWNILGPTAEVVPEGPAANIIAVLDENATPMTPAEVAKALGETRNYAKVTLHRMYSKDMVDRDPQGRYTVTADTGAGF